MKATYEQEASVNHFYDVITWDAQKKINRKKKPAGKTKKHLLCYLVNLTRTEPEEQEIDRQNTEPIEHEGVPV